MKRVRFIAAMTIVALLAFTACDNTANNEEANEETETSEVSEMDGHEGHDHSDHGDMGAMEGDEGMEGNATPVEPASFDQPAEAIKTQVSEVMTHYLDIKTSLAMDNAEGASHAASPLVRFKLDESNMADVPADQIEYIKNAMKKLSDDAVSINVTRDLPMQRKSFEELSSTVYALAKTFGSEQTLYYQYCPMAFDNKGAYWISGEEEIKNPYFGDAMLKCGRVEETIEM
ncbi:DUF3347 domain-containing protein [Roseivirga sp. BDSF3-8]|uniref:DUF3347 domain-containing protein n=1 Tax=Roseivirga sp. BDSF3-8 TaxID=3241598 RepID=UPI00353186E9